MKFNPGKLFSQFNTVKRYAQAGSKVLESPKGAAEMSAQQRERCAKIIHTTSVLAGGVGAGLAQIPLSDNAILIPLQTGMTLALAQVFDISLTRSAATATATTALATTIGRGASELLVGWLPGIGNVINATTAASITEAAGWTVANEFFKTWKEQHPQEAGLISAPQPQIEEAQIVEEREQPKTLAEPEYETEAVRADASEADLHDEKEPASV